MNRASELAQRLSHTDPMYKSFVMCAADILREGKYNQALLLDAVILAAEHVADEHWKREILNQARIVKYDLENKK